MQSAPFPPDEAQRLRALQDLQVLDSGAEEEFDALIHVASVVCNVPISLISLIDTERQWFKANVGLPGVSENPRDIAFCAHAILDSEVLEVEDALQDPRFHDNPLVVSQPDIRFYAGAPVVLQSGHRVGTLCVIDREPRKLDDQQRSILRALATAAAKALEGRRAMRQLQQAKEEAEMASRSKGQFLANMSHEIRTPMNAILGMLELLQNTELTTRQQDYITKTTDAARSLLGLLNDILDFSKVEAGKMTLEHEPFALEKLLRGLAVVLGANVGRKNIEVLFDIDPALPAQVVGDAMRLHQVLVNLGGNAVKFTAQGQVIVGLRQAARTATHARVEFSVKDTGIGIAPEHQQQIFSDFSQAEASTTRRFGGTGLGLAICKRLVELMGGDIVLTSTLGEGSTFAFALDLEVSPDEAAVAPPPLAMVRRHALVVDDNPVAAHLLQRMVESLGWECTRVASGHQALDWLTQRALPLPDVHRPDVIYLDWQMEGMDGWETAKRMHAMYAEAGQPLPPVIMVTAHGRQTLAQRTQAEQDLLAGFLVKPLTAPMLRDAYESALAGTTGLRKVGRAPSTQRMLAGMRVLVVEDNLINQQVAEELLSNRGAWVSLASNGQAGVDAVAAAAPQFDAVLMDIQMPVMDGYAATRVIRDNLGLASLPIIAMTANAMSGDREACLAAGMDEHVGKPFDIEQLASLLLRLTGFQSPQTDAADQPAAPALALQQLPDVPGLDLAQALERMSGMAALYMRTAQEFGQTLSQGVGPLQALLQGPDLSAAVRALHTLKGNAGTLGATALATEAARLEYLLRALDADTRVEVPTDKLADLMASACTSLNQAVQMLQAQLPVPAAPPAQPARPGPDLAWLQGLADRIAEADFAVLEMLAQGREQLARFPAPFAADFEEALQALDFEKAASLCKAQLEALPTP